MSPLADDLRAVGLNAVAGGAEVGVGAERIVVGVAEAPLGLRLRCELPCPGPVDPRAAAELPVFACGQPGDTTASLEGAGVVLTRSLVRPSAARLHDAVHSLARSAVSARGVVGALTATAAFLDDDGRAAVAAATLPPPQIGDPTDLVHRLAASVEWVGVDVAQPAWAAPDPSPPPVGQLVPAARYELVNRLGAWARVRTPDDQLVYTAAATLREAR